MAKKEAKAEADRPQHMEEKMALPLYRSHKKVRAARVVGNEGEVLPDIWALHLALPGETQVVIVHVSSEYITKHNPQIGGYYVLYEDGYESFSPGPAFDGGYVPADKAHTTPGHVGLTAAQAEFCRQIRNSEIGLGELVNEAKFTHKANPRWAAIAKTHFDEGYMALKRAVARPDD